MQQIQIVPKYVNPPKDASWANGTIKDQQNTLWTVNKNALGMFQPNQTALIGYEPAAGSRRYPHIVNVNGQPTEQQPVAGSFQQAGQAAQMPPQPAPLPQQQYHAPLPQQAPQAAPAPVQGTSKECGMWVMACLGKVFEGTGTFPDLKTLRDMIYNAKLAWEIEMEGKAEPQNTGQAGFDDRNPPPFNDEIPM